MKEYGLVGIGNAIVDILAYRDEKFLEENNLKKGTMSLIDEKEADRLYDLMGASTECSGGSAANTLAGFSMLGGKSSFIGRVRDDQLGEIFRLSLGKAGTEFNTPAATNGPATARCMVVVTEEESSVGAATKVERTMATYLGAAASIKEEDIDEELIRNAEVLFFEGYLWDDENARKSINKAIAIAEESGCKIAFTLSDPLCVQRHKDDFLDMVENHIDILFANEHEIEELTGEGDIRKVLFAMKDKCETVVITRSEKGSYVLTEGDIYTIDAVLTDNVFDVTGAGDLFASGFLYGYVNGFGPDKSAQLGAMCATEVIQYLGGRPVTKLHLLLENEKFKDIAESA